MNPLCPVGPITGPDFGEVGNSADVGLSEREEFLSTIARAEVETKEPQSKALTTTGAERYRSLGRQLSTDGNNGDSQVGVPNSCKSRSDYQSLDPKPNHEI